MGDLNSSDFSDDPLIQFFFPVSCLFFFIPFPFFTPFFSHILHSLFLLQLSLLFSFCKCSFSIWYYFLHSLIFFSPFIFYYKCSFSIWYYFLHSLIFSLLSSFITNVPSLFGALYFTVIYF